MEDEKKETIEELPESGIEIKVTDELPENTDAPENVDGSHEEKDTFGEGEEEKDSPTDETEEQGDESNHLDVPNFDIRRESTLDAMDKKHLWLSELEKKCTDLETDFISKIHYVAISNHFQDYLEELKSDESMLHFRMQFSKLFGKFRTAFIESQRHLNKINEIKAHISIANSENRKLKIQLENERQKVQELQENSDIAHGAMREMEKQIKSLQSMFNELRDEQADKSKNEQQVTETRHVGMHDEDEAEAKIRQLEEELELQGNELEFIKQRESMYQRKIQLAEKTKSSLHKELNSVKYELQKQTTRAEKAETVASENAEDVKNKNATIKIMTEERKQMELDLGREKEESRRLLKDLRKCQKELDGAAQVIEKSRRDLDIREDRIKMLVTQMDTLTMELTNKQMEVHALKGDISDITTVRNSLSRRVTLLEERCAESENKLDSARKEKSAQQKELDLTRKELWESESKTRELTKQKDALTEEVLKLEHTISGLESSIKVSEEKCRHLEKELTESQRFADQLKENIKKLETTKERLLKEIAELNRSISDSRGEIKRLELKISDMKKTESKLRQELEEEHAKYKLLAEDDRHSRRLLIESRHECEQLRDYQIVSSKNIEQLQSYNKDLDDRCKKQDSSIKNLKEHLGTTKEAYRQEVKNSDDLNAKLKRKDDQEQLLLKNLSEKESVILAFKMKAKNLMEEKNLQGVKLIKKDREISALKEDMRLLQQEVTTLDLSLNERINDIKLLKIQITQMNKSSAIANEKLEFIDVTRQGLINTENELIAEKVKSKALEGEVQRPVNLHRWRILEGIDPERAQLVAKNQALQKQLIKKMVDLENKELELREKEKLSKELQEQLRRRSESDIQEQLWTCKKELNARMERLKCLAGENDMFQNLCKKYEHEINALKDKLREYKQKELDFKALKKRKIL